MKTRDVKVRISLVSIALLFGNLTAGCASVGGTSVAPRAVSSTPAPKTSSSSVVQLTTFPQKFDVQGATANSFGFAVTQPGPITVEVQAQGAPVIVTLQSPGGQPMTQRGTGNVRLNYNVTPPDVQRNLFWQVQIRSWCEEDCLKAGRSVGSVMVQHPPVDQAAVQRAMGASTAR